MIIDVRVRPPFGSFLHGFLYDVALMEPACKVRGLNYPPSAREHDMELFIREMDEAGVDMAVLPIRKGTNGNNEDLVYLIEHYPGRFIGMIGVEACDDEESFKAIDTFILNGPCTGISLEPGMPTSKVQMRANDPRLFELYAECEKNNIPISMTYGGGRANRTYYNPSDINDIAEHFPNLHIILSHGGWPMVVETIQAVSRCPNIYLSADAYIMDYPGMYDYICAANYMLQDKMVFGSAYPGFTMKACVDKYRSVLTPAAFPKVMGDNACRALGILPR